MKMRRFIALAERYTNDNSYLLKYLKDGKFDPHACWHAVCQWVEQDPEAKALLEEILGHEIEDLSEENPDIFYKLPQDYQDGCEEWCYEYLMGTDPSSAPTHTHLSLEDNRLLKRETWLVHFSDDAWSIQSQGFVHGMDEMDKLGLTTYFPKAAKMGGYNFAYEATSRDAGWAASRGKYGKHAVLFQNSGVKTYHYADEEHQIIFWGADVDPGSIVLLYNDYGDWVVKNPFDGRDPFRGDFDKAVAWVMKNFRQYRGSITTGARRKIEENWEPRIQHWITIWVKPSGETRVWEQVHHHDALAEISNIKEDSVAIDAGWVRAGFIEWRDSTSLPRAYIEYGARASRDTIQKSVVVLSREFKKYTGERLDELQVNNRHVSGQELRKLVGTPEVIAETIDEPEQEFYVRFGDLPEGGRSQIGAAPNWIAAILQDDTHELGVSVYPASWDAGRQRWSIDCGNPASLDELLASERPAFLVTGDIVEDEDGYEAAGMDGEPLLRDVSILKRLEYHEIYVPIWGDGEQPEEYVGFQARQLSGEFHGVLCDLKWRVLDDTHKDVTNKMTIFGDFDGDISPSGTIEVLVDLSEFGLKAVSLAAQIGDKERRANGKLAAYVLFPSGKLGRFNPDNLSWAAVSNPEAILARAKAGKPFAHFWGS